MTVLKCKMCGGTLEFNSGETVAECPYCGTKQTVPLMDDDKKAALYERANRLRASADFDRAFSVYEGIAQAYPTDAEAFWGELLCKYGIEYVDDPATGKKIPTCHRSSYTSILDDEAFSMVMENADPAARKVYREQAKQIEEIRKGIIDISSREAPYDVFICYKETDENGERTEDSVLAQEVYDELTEKGYRVFFARISLEDKLGEEYEPYIFAALNSAKVMLVFGTDYEYFNAVWVKNEWSRFLDLMGKGEKKYLIPCYKGIDAYDMPKEFQRLQAQDMGKIGAIQDLIRGINKILPRATQQSQTVHPGFSSANSKELVKLGYLALEDEKWEEATNYFKQSLTGDAENSLAYFGLALAEKHASKPEYLPVALTKNIPSVEETLPHVNQTVIDDVISKYEVPGFLSKETIIKMLDQTVTFPVTANSLVSEKTKVQNYYEDDSNIIKARRFGDSKFNDSISKLKDETMRLFDSLISIAPVRDEQAKKDALVHRQHLLDKIITQIEQDSKQALQQKDKQEALETKKRKRKVLFAFAAAAVLTLAISGYFWFSTVYIPQSHYNKAISYMNNEQWEDAISEFKLSGNTNNEKFKECEYYSAISKFDNGDIESAKPVFEKYAGYYESDYYLMMIDITSKSDYDAIKELENYLNNQPNSAHSSQINSLIQAIRVRHKNELTEKIKKDKSTNIQTWEVELFNKVDTNRLLDGCKKWKYTYESGGSNYVVFHDDGTADFGGHGTSWPWVINDNNQLQISSAYTTYDGSTSTWTDYYTFRQITDDLYIAESKDHAQGYSLQIWEKE